MHLAIRPSHIIVAMIVGLLTPCCATGVHATEGARVDAVKSGAWGGPHIAMTVAPSGVDIEFDCGKATVPGAINTDRAGAFTATGTFLQERPGPTKPGGPPQRPMRLSGTVKGDDMEVKIVLTDRDEDVGTFTLGFGVAARLTRCK